jgi:ACS family hexuronate transporter-like MFS transporter
MMTGTTWAFIVAVLAPVLREELGFSATMLGVAYGVYYLSGSLWSTVAGRLVDRVGFRVAGTVLIVVSVAQHLILAGARGWTQLAVSGAVGGLGLALVNPVTNSMIGALLRGRSARNVVGAKQTGVPLGAVFAGTVAPVTAATLGWRGSVLSTLVVSALCALLLLTIRGSSGASPIGPARPQIRRRLGIERYVLGMGIIASGINGYLVLFVVDVFSSSVQRAGALAATIALSGASGRVLWASLGGGPRTFPILRTLGTVGALALAGFAVATSEPALWIAGVAFGLSIQAWQALGMVVVIESDSSGTIGASTARVMRDFYFGFVIGSPLTGFIIDRSGFRSAWMVLAIVAVLAVIALRRPDAATH